MTRCSAPIPLLDLSAAANHRSQHLCGPKAPSSSSLGLPRRIPLAPSHPNRVEVNPMALELASVKKMLQEEVQRNEVLQEQVDDIQRLSARSRSYDTFHTFPATPRDEIVISTPEPHGIRTKYEDLHLQHTVFLERFKETEAELARAKEELTVLRGLYREAVGTYLCNAHHHASNRRGFVASWSRLLVWGAGRVVNAVHLVLLCLYVVLARGLVSARRSSSLTP